MSDNVRKDVFFHRNQKSVELLTTIQDNIQSAQAAGTEKKVQLKISQQNWMI